VIASDPITIHPNPRPNEEHGGSGSSEEVGQKSPKKKENHITKGGGFASNADTDSPGNYEKGPDESDEANVFFESRDNGGAVSPNQEVVGNYDGGQESTDEGVPAVPEGSDEEGTHGD
jgi:hypothetical protein